MEEIIIIKNKITRGLLQSLRGGGASGRCIYLTFLAVRLFTMFEGG